MASRRESLKGAFLGKRRGERGSVSFVREKGRVGARKRDLRLEGART